MRTTFLAAAGLIASLTFATTSVQAASINCVTKENKNGTETSLFTITDAVAAACMDGNKDTLAEVNPFNAFGHNDWILAERNEASQPGGATGHIGFDSGHVNGSNSGTLSIMGPLPSDVVSIMVSLKTGSLSVALFDMNLADLTSFWSITDKDKGLSHSTLFYRVGDAAVVPLPAAGLMLLTALGGFAAIRRRKT